MDKFTTNLLIVSFVVFNCATCYNHYREDGYSIMRRMAEAGQAFDEHDVARIHLVQDHSRQNGRLFKRDLDAVGNDRKGKSLSILHLNLTSGSKIQLTLNPVALLSPDTVVSYQTPEGRMVRKHPQLDCYSHGRIQDSSGDGWAAVSHCDGVFGFAGTPEFEYFLHPIQSKKSNERIREDFDVHVIWKRSARGRNKSKALARRKQRKLGALKINRKKSDPQKVEEESQEGQNISKSFVIELAMFSDAQYWKLLQDLYPGREDDFLLTRLAAAQTLFADRDKVGYDVQIKLKLLEYWITNPVDYKFAHQLSNNLRSFCKHTQNRYFYDIHVLNTGISKKPNGVVGLAYGRGACSQLRCFATLAVRLNSFVVYAHEMGHTLGMSHYTPRNCPKQHNDIGGFMGGGMPYNFSPCMRHELTKFINSKNSICLFTESGHTDKLEQFKDNPTIFPGQIRQPDYLCHILAGQGYKYVRFEKPYRTSTCRSFFCLNKNESSPDFGRVQRLGTPLGLPCGDESLCLRKSSCTAWNQIEGISGHLETLREMKKEAVWSDWTPKFSSCSRSCGTGIRIRQRECLIKGFNLTPYCPGMAVHPELCNIHPCPQEPAVTSDIAIRLNRGQEECLRILGNRAHANQDAQTKDQPSSKTTPNVTVAFIHRDSCITKCTIGPKRNRESFEVILPDDTPCLEITRSQMDLRRFNIQMRCVKGLCLEISDCPIKSQIKDECGVCGGNGTSCVHLTFDSSYEVVKGKRRTLAIIPPRSTNIYIRKDKLRYMSVVLELWSHANNSIIGSGGVYTRERSDKRVNAVQFSGTRWVYTQNGALLRADGPTEQPVVIKVLRVDKPINQINLHYDIATGK